MSKIKQTKIPMKLDLDDMLQVATEQELIENEFNWELVRESDGLTKQSRGVKWLEFNNDGTYKDQFHEPKVGRSLIMSPFNHSYTWQTTTVTEIVEQKKGYIKFKTENSCYELATTIDNNNNNNKQ